MSQPAPVPAFVDPWDIKDPAPIHGRAMTALIVAGIVLMLASLVLFVSGQHALSQTIGFPGRMIIELLCVQDFVRERHPMHLVVAASMMVVSLLGFPEILAYFA